MKVVFRVVVHWFEITIIRNAKVELEENPALLTVGLCEVTLIEGTLTMEDLQTFGPLEMDVRQNKK